MQYKWKTGGLRRNWNFAFCLLEGPFLYLLSSEDHEKQKQKGVVPLAGCTTRVGAHHQRLYCFEVTHAERRGIVFDARAAGTLHRWVTSVAKVAVGPMNAPVQLGLYLEVLGLPPPPRFRRGAFRRGASAPAERESAFSAGTEGR